MDIKFIELEDVANGFIKPVPAVKHMPGWFKKTPAIKFMRDLGHKDMTIKKCVPVLDVFSTGYYFINTHDIYYDFNEDKGESYFSFDKKVLGTNKPITMHPFEQIDKMNMEGEYHEYAYKWSNPYVIETPPGYSCLFTQPPNQVLPFLTLSGVVDTDSHPLAVQFPFIMRKGFTGVIKANTPLVHIIPFEREEWNMQIIGKPSNLQQQNHSAAAESFNRSRVDSNNGINLVGGEYKKKHRKVKKYR